MSSEPSSKKEKEYKIKYNPVWAKDLPLGPCNTNPYVYHCIPFNSPVCLITKFQVTLMNMGVTHKKNKQAIKTTRHKE